MTILEQLDISINMANYIKEETQDGIDTILDNALSRDKFANWIVDNKHELNVYLLKSVYVDKVLILEVPQFYKKGLKINLH